MGRGESKKPPAGSAGGFSNKSLTITYFHTGCSTIIGAKSFHGPVRDGKGWYRLAMVIRHDLYECRSLCMRHSESGRSGFLICCLNKQPNPCTGNDCQGYRD